MGEARLPSINPTTHLEPGDDAVEIDMGMRAAGGEVQAIPISDTVQSVPMQATPLTLKYKHLPTAGGTVTVISRLFAEPERCRLCPVCNHDRGGCLVIAPEFVPPASCGRYRLRG